MSGYLRLLIGAPVCRREWIITRWIDHVVAAIPENTDFAFVLIGGEEDPTFSAAKEHIQGKDLAFFVDYIKEERQEDLRDWTVPRYFRMVELRNHLLGRVRELRPDYFLSLDTDILIHPDSIRNLIESAEKFDAVGGRAYMTPRGRSAPTLGFMNVGRMRREDNHHVVAGHIIMAMKLMTPKAYDVDYSSHRLGEDIGWCLNARKAGVKIGFDGRVGNKHVMTPDMLNKIDTRVGF